MKTGYTQKHSYIDLKKTSAVQFGLLSPGEIQRMSVANLHSEKIYDELTFLPQKNAINDPRMGIANKD
jgi:DNA-directed RNA polymerase beta' subunit